MKMDIIKQWNVLFNNPNAKTIDRKDQTFNLN